MSVLAMATYNIGQLYQRSREGLRKNRILDPVLNTEFAKVVYECATFTGQCRE